jgi:hypothetical protein
MSPRCVDLALYDVKELARHAGQPGLLSRGANRRLEYPSCRYMFEDEEPKGDNNPELTVLYYLLNGERLESKDQAWYWMAQGDGYSIAVEGDGHRWEFCRRPLPEGWDVLRTPLQEFFRKRWAELLEPTDFGPGLANRFRWLLDASPKTQHVYYLDLWWCHRLLTKHGAEVRRTIAAAKTSAAGTTKPERPSGGGSGGAAIASVNKHGSKPYKTQKDIATHYGVVDRTVRNWLRIGPLTGCRKIGGEYRVTPAQDAACKRRAKVMK